MQTNIELKAYCKNKDKIRELLLWIGAVHKSIDSYTDTYFHSKSGRLKLRQGTNENKLIHYLRKDQKGASESHVNFYSSEPNSSLKEILEKTLGTRCIVEKTREIYSIDNVNFHIDTVKYLGDFIEIKAENRDDTISKEKLQEQCNYYIKALEINAKDLTSESYSDILQQNNLFSQILVDE